MLTPNEKMIAESILVKRDNDVSVEDIDALEVILNRHLNVTSKTRGRGFDVESVSTDDQFLRKIISKYQRAKSYKLNR